MHYLNPCPSSPRYLYTYALIPICDAPNPKGIFFFWLMDNFVTTENSLSRQRKNEWSVAVARPKATWSCAVDRVTRARHAVALRAGIAMRVTLSRTSLAVCAPKQGALRLGERFISPHARASSFQSVFHVATRFPRRGLNSVAI